MYALIASDSAALRSAASVLLNSFDPLAELLFASSLGEIEAYLNLGCVKSAVIDPNIAGYGRDFDLARLAQAYPAVRFSALAPAAIRPNLFDGADTHPMRPPAPQPEAQTPLTARQHDVLRLLREGRSTKEIARRLNLAVPTVKTHLAALYRQLGARNRVEAVMKAVAPRPSNHTPSNHTPANHNSAIHDRLAALGRHIPAA